MHHGSTVCAKSFKVARCVVHGLVFDHTKGWRFRCSALEAIESAGRTWALCGFALLIQPRLHLTPENERGARVIESRQAGLDPAAYRVFVDAQL